MCVTTLSSTARIADDAKKPNTHTQTLLAGPDCEKLMIGLCSGNSRSHSLAVFDEMSNGR